MGFIKSGFTGGFIGIVIGFAAIFTKSAIVQKLASVGFLLAAAFGKVCIDTLEGGCTLAQKFTTIIATIVGNCIAYFIIGVLISLGISLLKTSSSSEKPSEVAEQEVKVPEKVVIINPNKEQQRPTKPSKKEFVKN